MAERTNPHSEIVVGAQDQATPVFDKIKGSAQGMANAVEKSAHNAGKAVEGIGQGAQPAAGKIDNATKSIIQSIERATAAMKAGEKGSAGYFEALAKQRGVSADAIKPYVEELRRAEAAQRAATQGIHEMSSATAMASRQFSALGGAIAGAFSVRAFVTASDAVTQLNNQLRLATGSTQDAASAYQALYEIGQRSRTNFVELGKTFASISRATGELGVSQAQLLRMSEAIGNAVAISGVSAQASEAALIQLTQGMASGVLRGEELNSVMEQTPRLSKALADGLNVPIGKLREMGKAGELSSERVIKALLSQSEVLRNEVRGSVATISQSMTTLANSSTMLSGEIDRVTGASALMAAEIKAAAESLDSIGRAFRETSSAGEQTSIFGDAVATVFETVAVLGANVAFVFKSVGRELGGMAAQAAAIATLNFSQAAAIRQEMLADAEAARREVDATSERILNARRVAAEARAEQARWATRNASAMTDPRRVDTLQVSGGVKTGPTKAQVSAVNRELEAQAKLIAELNGLTGSFAEDWERLTRVFTDKSGVVNVEALTAAQKKLLDQQPFMREQAKAIDESEKAYRKYLDGLQRSSDAIGQQADQQEAANASYGKSKTAIAELTLAQMKLALAQEKDAGPWSPEAIAKMEEAIRQQGRYVDGLKNADFTKANRALDEAVTMASEQHKLTMEELSLIGLTEVERRKIIAAREIELDLAKDLRDIDKMTLEDEGDREILKQQAREKARIRTENAIARATLNEWQRTADEINRSLTDALLRGFESGKGFAENFRDTLKNMFNTLVLRPIISAVMTPVSGMVNGMVQGGMNAVGLGGNSNLLGMASNASSAYSLLTGGSIGAGMAASMGSAITSIGTAIGSSAATSFGAGMAGSTLAPGLMGPTTVGATGAMGAGASAGSLLSAIPGWGWALAGIGALFGGDIINGLFGRKLKDSGIEGAFGGASGFEGRQFEYYKGGLFRSDKTKYKDLDEEIRAALADTFNAMRSGAKEMAGVLGLGTQAIDGFTAHVKVSLKGLSAEEADKRLKEEFDKVAESLASTTLGTQDYTRAGETALQTLTRLSGSLTGVNQVFENLGATLYASSLAGADMASQLVDLFGGMDGLSQTAGSYMQNYYSADEQRAAVQRQLQKAFDGLNLKLPDIDAADARAQFRALAEAQDLTTDAGRKTYASLLQLSGAFAGITQSADEAAQAAQRLADQQQRQADDAVNQALAQLRQVVKRERDALSAQADALKSVIGQIGGAVGLLTSNARELYGSVDSTQQMLAAQGMVYIEDALAGVRAGASVVDYGGLADAIGAARSGVNAGVYASEFERQRDTLVLAGQLAELGQISDAQLSVEERALKAVQEQIAQLDKTLDYWEQQASGMGDLLNASLSIEGAIGSLAAALAQREAAKQPAGGGGGGRPGVDFNQGLQQQIAEAWNAGDWITAQNIIRGYGFSNDQLKDAFDLNYADLRYLYSHGYTGQNPGDYSFSAKTAEGVYAEAKAQGLTLAEVDKLINAPAGTAEEWAKANGLPIFHQGTNYVPRTGFALLEQGEQVVPRANNPFAGGQMPQGNNAELIAEVRALRAEVAALRAPMEQTAQATAQQAEQFDNVTAGGNAMATEVMA